MKCVDQGLVKKHRGAGPEQRGGEWVNRFEPLVRGGSFNFQLPMEVAS